MRMGHAWVPAAAWAAGAAGAALVGLTAVSAVRDYVADAPVQSLSVAEIEALLGEPGASLEPIATVAAAPSLPAHRTVRAQSLSSAQPRGNADDRGYGRDNATLSAQGSSQGSVDPPEEDPPAGTTGATGTTGRVAASSGSEEATSADPPSGGEPEGETDTATGATGATAVASGGPDPTAAQSTPDPGGPAGPGAEATGSP